jgi:hypothetical protein
MCNGLEASFLLLCAEIGTLALQLVFAESSVLV